jgi:hypothetical protein
VWVVSPYTGPTVGPTRDGGWVPNNKRIHPLWRDRGLLVPYRKNMRPLRGIVAVGAFFPIRSDAVWAIDVVAQLVDKLLEAKIDASAWSSTRIETQTAHDTTDGSIIVQAIHSETITGKWRGHGGERSADYVPGCTIFSTTMILIVHEEAYCDMASIRKQLGH